ncbi:hypothetical protein LEP1GSC050_2779 [Leptospira broomii serovar Hurstbridge str. 5399]|uniref:Uncharacterized protein n=1 Tax=Leptospira broomii serovar Hurstbridge str. 5399 TaxID=1049789 RepID=T0FC39_9LEPT|nr:hypothetical protein [Leptospira broomii]EQA45132.1 hypothetical protein LEP1GSC050_2779 [Leptospira broomii serovar Hurstbridge str. 5399]
MKNAKYLLTVVLLGFGFLNCPGKSNSSSSMDTLLPIALLGASKKQTGVGTGGSGARCSSSSDCNASTVCVSGYNLDSAFSTSICYLIPTANIMTVNGTAVTGTINDTTQLVDYNISIPSAGTYLLAAFAPSVSSLDLVIQIMQADGRTIVTGQVDATGSGLRERTIYNFPASGIYRLRVASFYTSGTFGGSFSAQIVSQAVSGGGSCNFITSGVGSYCQDFSPGSTFNSSACSGGTFSSNQSCATVNSGASPTVSGRCTYSPNIALSSGQGFTTRVYYSAGTGVAVPFSPSAASTDCSSVDSIDSIFQ